MFKENQAIYGYRRIHSELKNRKIIMSKKVARKLMKEEKLTVIKNAAVAQLLKEQLKIERRIILY
ncbi:IS3 family transposase [Marinilactibacillus psychrotolerans]|uniref:IS3 family transposase n=1 Tax=Marinilactibacillus psychrotolerans TaxID=191770 RepID=UPI003530E614